MAEQGGADAAGRRTYVQRKARTRDSEVLEKAIGVFYRKGFAATSIQDLADELGMLKSSLYYYISSKEQLLRRIFEDSHAGAMEVVARVEALEAPPLERIHAYLQQYAEWFLTNSERASLYAREWRYLTGEFYDEVVAQRAYYDDVLIRLIDEAKEAGDVPPGLSTRYATYFVLGSLSSINDWYRPSGADDPQTIATVWADMGMRLLTHPDDPKELPTPAPRRRRKPSPSRKPE
ncbi:TetR/AcrR family transcriptional regulator [Pseudonocardia kujensis]|uniref:TetR/AcrR family transcriptional regulator n=1 Tax=Pseudonocardia kujensis TaxID=1128675 RepID=UPI001E3336A3|nr:TetR/AcrR family transcriptional regulator [Pseudonocardia kujensis]MCE0761982.1 TetR/AcrR family transcriptional regulator [Pseudonocardia kujensis]